MALVKNNRNGVWSTNKYVVLPKETGIIADEDWAKLKKIPSVKGMLDTGELEEVKEKGE